MNQAGRKRGISRRSISTHHSTALDASQVCLALTHMQFYLLYLIANPSASTHSAAWTLPFCLQRVQKVAHQLIPALGAQIHTLPPGRLLLPFYQTRLLPLVFFSPVVEGTVYHRVLALSQSSHPTLPPQSQSYASSFPPRPVSPWG